MSRLVDLIAEQNAVAFKEAIQEKIASKVIFALEQEKIAVAQAMLESKDEEDDEDEDEMDDEEDDENMKEELELMEAGDLSIPTLYKRWADHHSETGSNSLAKANAVEKAIRRVHGAKVMKHLKNALTANLRDDTDAEKLHLHKALSAAGKSNRIGATVGKGRSAFRKEEAELMEGDSSALDEKNMNRSKRDDWESSVGGKNIRRGNRDTENRASHDATYRGNQEWTKYGNTSGPSRGGKDLSADLRKKAQNAYVVTKRHKDKARVGKLRSGVIASMKNSLKAKRAAKEA